MHLYCPLILVAFGPILELHMGINNGLVPLLCSHRDRSRDDTLTIVRDRKVRTASLLLGTCLQNYHEIITLLVGINR